ncbi:LysR family transcriptional regulator [Methylocella sp.]|uniref:LysR family transcriptional regulator n=1 Tax=Methylocella sp. TaxID=1978226 RepID=UPI003783F847
MSDARAWEMTMFLHVSRAGSFSAAGRAVGMTPASTAKLVSRIEARLGARLVECSTRRLRLTPEGELYRTRAEELIEDLDALDAEIGGGAAAPRGLLRVSASVPFGRHCLLPLVPSFAQDYPSMKLELSLTDEVVDFYDAQCDVAFRIGELADSGLTAARLGRARRRVVAAPSYLVANGTPATVDDLARHNCLGFSFRRAAAVWPLKSGGRLVDREVRGRIAAGDGETVRELAVLGLGLARLAEFHVARDLAEGRLVSVLDEAMVDAEEAHALYFGRKRLPRRIQVFLDFMTPRLRAALAAPDRR